MEITEHELRSLTESIRKAYGYDFSGYAQASLLRRINRFVERYRYLTLKELEEDIAANEPRFEMFLQELTVNVTELFRDPMFFKALREKVVPDLKTYPFVKIWDAGCSTGEEIYSLAILLSEEGIYSRSKIYATDINQKVLIKAREGIYPLHQMKEFSSNYFKSGGRQSLSDYYTAKYERVSFDESLKKNIVYAAHNLATDNSFNEFNLIVCRNVLIYFNRELQERVLKLFMDSLTVFGYLALGTKETISVSKYKHHFEVVDAKERIYRKIRD